MAAEEESAAGGAPRLDLDGFSGPLDLLLELARAQRLDLHRIALSDLLDQLAPALRQAAPLSERGSWLVMAASIVLLRSHLLLHVGPEPDLKARGRADRQARQLRAQLLGLQRVQDLAVFLDRQPQLGRDTFGRGSPATNVRVGEAGRVVDVVGFFWAVLDLLNGKRAGTDAADVHALPKLALHSIADACARILRLLASNPQSQPLAQFLPDPSEGPGDAEAHAGAPPTPRGALLRRSGWASAFAASLELAKQGQVTLTQNEAFSPILVRTVPKPDAASPHASRPGRGQATPFHDADTFSGA